MLQNNSNNLDQDSKVERIYTILIPTVYNQGIQDGVALAGEQAYRSMRPTKKP
jgi:uncharacterized protein (DUF2164 family)